MPNIEAPRVNVMQLKSYCDLVSNTINIKRYVPVQCMKTNNNAGLLILKLKNCNSETTNHNHLFDILIYLKMNNHTYLLMLS